MTTLSERKTLQAQAGSPDADLTRAREYKGGQLRETLNDAFFDCGWEIIEEREAPGGGKILRVGGRFQHAERRNGNNRVYPLKLFEKIFEDQDVNERISHRRMLGELEHPTDGQTDLKRVAHLITKLELREDGEVYGELDVLNTPMGQIAQELFRHGVTVGVSSRGRGSSYSRTGADGQTEEVVDDDYVLETFDLVYNPSTPDAFLTRLKSMPESISEEAKEIADCMAVAIQESRKDSPRPSVSRAGGTDMKELREKLGIIDKRAGDLLRLVTECEPVELSRHEDETLNFMVEAEDALIQQPALRPLVDRTKLKLNEVKTAIESRRDGTERRLNEEVERYLEPPGDVRKIEEGKQGSDGVAMITVPADLFRGLAEDRAAHASRARELAERQSRLSEQFVTRKRFNTAVRLVETVVRKGRGFKNQMETARARDGATTELLERFIDITDDRQVKIETSRILRWFPQLKPWQGTLLECVSSRHVRRIANSLLEGLAESKSARPSAPARSRRPRVEKRRRVPERAPIVTPAEGIVESKDRGLAAADSATRKLGWGR